MTRPAPVTYGPSWLPLIDATSSEPAVDRGFGVGLELSDHLAFLLERYTCNSNYLAKAAFIAYATTFRTRCRRPPRPARGPGAPRPARVRRLAGPAQGARHAPASARH